MERLGGWWLVRAVLRHGIGRGRPAPAEQIFVIEGMSWWSRRVASLIRACGVRLTVSEVEFDFADDVRLPDGSRAIEHIYFKAAPVLVARVEEDPDYGRSVAGGLRTAAHEPYVRAFLAKRMLAEAYLSLRSIMVATWYCRVRLPGGAAGSVVYVKDGWLFATLAEYAERWNVELRVHRQVTFRWRAARRRLLAVARAAYLRLRALRPAAPPEDRPPRVAAEMYLNGIRREPTYHTEFLWYRKPTLPAGAVFGYFAHPQDQPTPERQMYLEAGGIGWIDRATMRRLMYEPAPNGSSTAPRALPRLGRRGATKMQAAVRARLEEFYTEYDRWYRFFVATGTRVHVSTSDIFPESEAVHAAVAAAGGVAVSLQRSIERDPYVLRRTVTDVHFAFAGAQAERERLSGSVVRQFVVAGYPFDGVFPAVRAHARQLVEGMRRRGVEFAVCFLDENDGVHRKWLGGQSLIRTDYSFLCDRLEADSTLGLVLKPKRPETLAQRLGPVWARVQAFVDTGRCVILSGRPPDERYLPCVGACAADLSINLLYGGTPGLESVLAGTPALLIRHDVDRGAFERLPEGSVVFDTWDDLWKAVERYRADRSDPHVGNWEPILDEFASLRDGRAAERIGSYIGWLYEAFASGRSRDAALAHAASRYAATWGRGLVTEVTPAGLRPVTVSEDGPRRTA